MKKLAFTALAVFGSALSAAMITLLPVQTAHAGKIYVEPVVQIELGDARHRNLYPVSSYYDHRAPQYVLSDKRSAYPKEAYRDGYEDGLRAAREAQERRRYWRHVRHHGHPHGGHFYGRPYTGYHGGHDWKY